MSILARFARARRGATVVEFALIAGVFLPLCLAVFDASLLLWTRGALQSVAALTARCSALASPLCTNIQQFAVTQAENWIVASIIAKANVVVTPSSVCVSHVKLTKVTITCPYWAGAVLPPPLNGVTIVATAYFPVAAPAC